MPGQLQQLETVSLLTFLTIPERNVFKAWRQDLVFHWSQAEWLKARLRSAIFISSCHLEEHYIFQFK